MLYGGTTVVLQPEDAALCSEEVCEAEVVDHQDHICQGADIR